MIEKIVITTSSFAEYDTRPIDLLRENGFAVIRNTSGHTISGEEAFRLCNDCVGIVAGTEAYSRKVLGKFKRLKVISRCGSGIENIDINSSKDFGIKVMNTPDAPTLAVAELTLGLILGLLRKVSLADRNLRGGKWKKITGNLLSRKKIGIIGFGRVGKKLSELLGPFNCKIAYTDPFAEGGHSLFKNLPLPMLLPWADIITIHAAGKDIIMGEKEIRQMKKKSWLINTSRGCLIDENALFKALKAGNLSGAAIDVFNEEPYQGQLSKLDNVILTPHIGSYALESRIAMEKEAVKNLLKVLEDIK